MLSLAHTIYYNDTSVDPKTTVYFEIKQDSHVQNCLADQRGNVRQTLHQLHSNTAQLDESETLRWLTQAKQDLSDAASDFTQQVFMKIHDALASA